MTLPPAEQAALREKALKATPGPWTVNVEIDGGDDVGDADFVLIDIPQIGRALHDTDWAEPEDRERDLDNTEFIAAANPSTVLALLDELEARTQEVERLKAWELKVRQSAFHGRLVPPTGPYILLADVFQEFQTKEPHAHD